jgi:tetrapyrrole methylase family protein/MazG family protein
MHITIASMDASGEVSGKVISAAKAAAKVVLQTDIAAEFKENGIAYETLDQLYKVSSSFDELIKKSAEVLLCDGLLFVALGDIPGNRIAANLVKRIKEKGGSVTVIPGGDAALCIAFEEGFADSLGGVSIYNSASFDKISDTGITLVVNEIDNRLAASELKLKLSKYYGDMHIILFSDIKGKTKKKIPLSMLDCEQSYGYYTSIVVAPSALENKKRYTFSDLISIMDKLRSRDGCPWDREQTHESLKRYLVEESYEVIEAIDDGDMDALHDELGDVLLQVVFHAKIAGQCGEFDISDVTTAICSKMISRHTHIFGNATADTPEAVLKNWDQIKKAEKGQQTQAEVLRNVPKSMPALMRSEKVQAKAARSGMDFSGIDGAISKLKEEIAEVEQSLNKEGIAEECGDLLFSAVNVSRLAGVEPETALQKAADKFISRFDAAESYAKKRNIDMKTCSPDELNEIWDMAKCHKKN